MEFYHNCTNFILQQVKRKFWQGEDSQSVWNVIKTQHVDHSQEKRLLEMVGGYDNDVDVGMGDKKSEK